MAVTKRCRGCGHVLPAEQFYRNRSSPDGCTSSCRRCCREANRRWRAANKERRAAYNREYRQRHPEKARQLSRAHRLSINYGLSRDGYEDMLKRQEGQCAICGGDNGRDELCVDHEHATGAIRGLLCRRCNAVLGFAGDSAQRLRDAAAYLRRSGQGVPSCG